MQLSHLLFILFGSEPDYGLSTLGGCFEVGSDFYLKKPKWIRNVKYPSPLVSGELFFFMWDHVVSLN